MIAYASIDPGKDDPQALLARLDGLDAGDLRLGICDEHFWNDCSPGIAEGVKAAIDEEYADCLATLDPNIKARFDLATEVSAVDYYTEERQIERLADAVDDAFRHVDVLVAPTVPMMPPTVAEVADADRHLNAKG